MMKQTIQNLTTIRPRLSLSLHEVTWFNVLDSGVLLKSFIQLFEAHLLLHVEKSGSSTGIIAKFQVTDQYDTAGT